MSFYDRHSGKSKFRQDGTYKPKTENHVRDDWRRRKGFQKDQSKSPAWCNCGRYLKTRGNRQDRRYVKRMIYAEKWDQIQYHQDQFVSSWDAC